MLIFFIFCTNICTPIHQNNDFTTILHENKRIMMMLFFLLVFNDMNNPQFYLIKDPPLFYFMNAFHFVSSIFLTHSLEQLLFIIIIIMFKEMFLIIGILMQIICIHYCFYQILSRLRSFKHAIISLFDAFDARPLNN